MYNYKFYIGKINTTKIIILKSNIGKVFSAIATTLLIHIYKPNLILNIGTAGSLTKKLNPGDFAIAKKISYFDVDLRTFNYNIGQIPNCPIFFKTDESYTKKIKSMMYKKKYNFLEGLIISGDTFVGTNKKNKKIKSFFPKSIAIDMECAAVAHVCYVLHIPLISIRIISDKANENSNYDFKNFINKSSKIIFLIVTSILKIIF
ncbi:5'-methylthioadenosine/adenosylhomocysteine nucleosidase [Buchnera aphidicola]|uniref:5'-methylthioadenosine/adenosylhomocysteine nucleosidase n=1 Tax=Buchnera aphidicola TaxID=9 RepID=UPI00346396AE